MNVKDVTIYDIAKVLNVSPATVSRGLKNHPGIHVDTKKRIAEAAQKMGYQQNTFASNLRKKSSNTLGVIVPRLNSYFMSTVIAGIEKVANAHGYNLLISQSQETYKKEIDSVVTMFNSRVDGLLISLAADTQDTSHLEALIRKQTPLIFFDRVIDHPECTSVVIDNKRGGYDATKHLIEQGCRKIVHVDGNVNRNVFADRLEGYKEALLEAHINFRPEYVINSTLDDKGGTEAAKQILALNEQPDGIFTANDTTGVACIRQIKAAGIRVPHDIAVVGFNNDPLSTVIEPNLTTINYPGLEMGEIAANTLITKLKNGPASNLNTVVLRHSLIIRESSQKLGKV